MINKVYVTLEVPIIEKKYDIFLPIDKTIYVITALLVKGICDVSGNQLFTNKVNLYNKIDGTLYSKNAIIKDTNIRNGSVIVLC